MRRIILLLTLSAVMVSMAAAVHKTAKTKKRKPAKTVQTAPPRPDEWALVNVAAACLRTEPSHASQLETQASYGTPAKILDRHGEWLRLELPDGYKAWMIGSSLIEKKPQEIDRWRESPRLIVTQPRPAAAFSDSLNTSDGNIAFDIVLGSIFEGNKTPGSRFTRVTLPDGRTAFVNSDYVEDFSTWSKRPPEIDTIMNVARSMTGVTYLWGGTTPKAVDCSGFTKLAFGAAGLILPRNASDQALTGETLDPANTDAFRQGDLLFFGSGTGTNITHVGIYDGFSRFIHASGRVFESSFKPGHPLYIPRKVIGAARILGNSAPKGITPYSAHPWYFNQK